MGVLDDRECKKKRFSHACIHISDCFHFTFTTTHLNKSPVKQRLRSVSMYLLQASTARGLVRTWVMEADPIWFTLCFCISFTMYAPVSSFPWVPPQMATRDSGGKQTCSICWAETQTNCSIRSFLLCVMLWQLSLWVNIYQAWQRECKQVMDKPGRWRQPVTRGHGVQPVLVKSTKVFYVCQQVTDPVWGTQRRSLNINL